MLTAALVLTATLPVPAIVERVAIDYGICPHYGLAIARLESDYEPLAIGDNGRAAGTHQFHEESWRIVREKMGRDPDPMLRFDPWQSAETWAYACAEMGLWEWWSTHEMAEGGRWTRKN